MLKPTLLALTLLAAASVLGAAVQDPKPAPVVQESKLPKAPDFKALGTDGAEHTLASLTKAGPVFLYFIKHDCPINTPAIAYYARLHEAHGKKGNIVGVYGGSAEKLKKLKGGGKLNFTVLLDPDKKIIKAYGAKRSPWVIEVGQKGEIAETWKGWSGEALEELSERVAKALGTKTPALDVGGSPERMTYG